MLKGISPLISPELLAVLARMGHGDEIVLADAHFPGETFNNRVLRADGLRIPDLLNGILPLFVLDPYVDDPLVMMAAVEGDSLDPSVEEAYLQPIKRHAPDAPAIARIDRFDFYDRAKEAFAVLMTGETAKYGNIILKKGVTFWHRGFTLAPSAHTPLTLSGLFFRKLGAWLRHCRPPPAFGVRHYLFGGFAPRASGAHPTGVVGVAGPGHPGFL